MNAAVQLSAVLSVSAPRLPARNCAGHTGVLSNRELQQPEGPNASCGTSSTLSGPRCWAEPVHGVAQTNTRTQERTPAMCSTRRAWVYPGDVCDPFLQREHHKGQSHLAAPFPEGVPRARI